MSFGYYCTFVDADNHVLTSFDIDDHPESLESPNKSAELMRYHYRLGHLSFQKLRLLAILERSRRNTKSSCRYYSSEMCWMPLWCHDPSTLERQAKSSFHAVYHLSIYKAWPSGINRSNAVDLRRIYCTIERKVDNSSVQVCNSICRPLFSLSSADTIAAKNAFETHAMSMGVTIAHYHCDNGRF